MIKRLSTSIFFLFVLPLSVFAVQIKDLPAFLQLNFFQFVLDKDAADIIRENPGFEDDEIQAIQTAMEQIRRASEINRGYPLQRKKSGRGIYHGETSSLDKVEIYSKGGRDMLMVQAVFGPRGIVLRAYAEIETLSPTQVIMKDKSPTLAIGIPRYPYESYDRGGDLIFIGRSGVNSVIVPKTFPGEDESKAPTSKDQKFPGILSLSLSHYNLQTTAQKILAEMRAKYGNVNMEQADSIRAVMESLRIRWEVNTSLYLTGSNRGRANYSSGKTEEAGGYHADIFTRGGKKYLKVQSSMGHSGILFRATMPLKSVSDKVIMRDERPTVEIAIPRHPSKNFSQSGGDVFQVGDVAVSGLVVVPPLPTLGDQVRATTKVCRSKKKS